MNLFSPPGSEGSLKARCGIAMGLVVGGKLVIFMAGRRNHWRVFQRENGCKMAKFR